MPGLPYTPHKLYRQGHQVFMSAPQSSQYNLHMPLWYPDRTIHPSGGIVTFADIRGGGVMVCADIAGLPPYKVGFGQRTVSVLSVSYTRGWTM